MKTLKILFALIIFWSFSASLTNAQEMKNGTDSYYIPNVPVFLELRCGDTVIDLINLPSSNVEARMIEHWRNDVMIWAKFMVYGTVEFKGVTYEMDGLVKLTDEDFNTQVAHYNVKGDDGSHYVGIFSITDGTATFIFSKALCPGN